ncbi:MAG: lipoate--protein ligase family protein [Bacillota bacterium]
MEKWRLIDTGINNAYYNMAVDEAIMKASRKDLVPPTIRFYQWSPPGLTLGYSQTGKQVVNEKKCKQNQVDVVRRLTGGRTILHDDELTYSIIVKEDSGILPGSIIDSYKIISEGIVKGFKILNIPVDLKPFDKNKSRDKGFSAACFDSPSWYEVLINGKKLVGSAQTRRKGIILQHGSLPFSIDAEKLYNLLKINGDRKNKIRNKMVKRFLNKATAVNNVSEKNISPGELKKSLKKGWETVFKVSLKPGSLIQQEKIWVKKLIREKYKTREWNYREK